MLSETALFDPRLTGNQLRVLLALIHLARRSGSTGATNGQLADMLQCSRVHVSQSITTLCQAGYIKRQSNDVGHRILIVTDLGTPPIPESTRPSGADAKADTLIRPYAPPLTIVSPPLNAGMHPLKPAYAPPLTSVCTPPLTGVSPPLNGRLYSLIREEKEEINTREIPTSPDSGKKPLDELEDRDGAEANGQSLANGASKPQGELGQTKSSQGPATPAPAPDLNGRERAANALLELFPDSGADWLGMMSVKAGELIHKGHPGWEWIIEAIVRAADTQSVARKSGKPNPGIHWGYIAAILDSFHGRGGSRSEEIARKARDKAESEVKSEPPKPGPARTIFHPVIESRMEMLRLKNVEKNAALYGPDWRAATS